MFCPKINERAQVNACDGFNISFVTLSDSMRPKERRIKELEAEKQTLSEEWQIFRSKYHRLEDEFQTLRRQSTAIEAESAQVQRLDLKSELPRG